MPRCQAHISNSPRLPLIGDLARLQQIFSGIVGSKLYTISPDGIYCGMEMNKKIADEFLLYHELLMMKMAKDSGGLNYFVALSLSIVELRAINKV